MSHSTMVNRVGMAVSCVVLAAAGVATGLPQRLRNWIANDSPVTLRTVGCNSRAHTLTFKVSNPSGNAVFVAPTAGQRDLPVMGEYLLWGSSVGLSQPSRLAPNSSKLIRVTLDSTRWDTDLDGKWDVIVMKSPPRLASAEDLSTANETIGYKGKTYVVTDPGYIVSSQVGCIE